MIKWNEWEEGRILYLNNVCLDYTVIVNSQQWISEWKECWTPVRFAPLFYRWKRKDSVLPSCNYRLSLDYPLALRRTLYPLQTRYLAVEARLINCNFTSDILKSRYSSVLKFFFFYFRIVCLLTLAQWAIFYIYIHYTFVYNEITFNRNL